MKNKKAFTLVEILVWILIVSIILISGFQAYSMALAWKIRLIEKTKLQKEIIFFTERLFQAIKWGWTIDYEEYFNRMVVWTNTKSWHYELETWFGNFGRWWDIPEDLTDLADYWEWFYYCRSFDWNKMSSTWWCFEWWGFMSNWSGDTINPSGNDYQRYWQYSFQFLDYNSDYDNDFWDVDRDLNIIWDDDDFDNWNWPRVFTWSSDVKGLYLISWNKKVRTYFRHNVVRDPDAPLSVTCDSNGTWSWCLWTIQFLKLEWKDWWMDHDRTSSDSTQDDWVIDTWVVDRRFSWVLDQVAWAKPMDSYRKNLFPDNVNVSDFRVFPYPNIEEDRAWNLTTDEISKIKISPYVILSIETKPSWKIKKKIKWNTKPVRFNTTINLTDIFSN